jgi:hypothetical protein
MAVPNIFANVTTSIPLSQLDTNFATAIVLGNTSVYLGNTTTTLSNLSLANVTMTSTVKTTGTGYPKTVTVYTGGSGTYTTPANCTAIYVRCVGGGGGGGGSGNAGSPTSGGTGGSTTFGSLTANGGAGGPNSLTGGFQGGGPGGATGGDLNINGNPGQTAPGNSLPALFRSFGVNGGNSIFGGAGLAGTNGSGAVTVSATSGGGGGGVGGDATTYASAGGGSGGYCEKLITSPSATYSYAVGAGGTAGAAGTGGSTGGTGGAGLIVITEYYY